MLIKILLFGILTIPTWAQAAIDCNDANVSVVGDDTPADPDVYLTYTAPSGTNKITIVGTGFRAGGATRDPVPTIGGNAMTGLGTVAYQDPAGGRLWYRLGVTAGSADVSVDWDSTPLASAHGVVTCTGVDQVSPIRASNQATGTGTTATVTVTGCLAGDKLIDFVTKDAGTNFTVGANQSELAQSAIGEMEAAMSQQDGADGEVMSWTLSSDQWTIQAVCLAPATETDTGGDALWFP